MDQIELVRSKTDIVELISSYISLKKAGRNFKALCPFHSEKTPSFVVSPERQIFKCFGCQEGGNVFNFLMKYENMEFGEALRFLADRAGIKLKSLKPSKSYQEKEKLLAINHLASEFYHYILTNHKAGKRGLDYLLKRGINRSSIKIFKLGYAPENWENLQDFLAKKKGYHRLDLEKAGLIIQSSKIKNQSSKLYYDRFRGRIIFPLFNHRGDTVGFAGRTLKPDLKGAKYINTPETLVYHKSDLFYGLNMTKKAIKEKNQAVIVEGELDLISSYQAGVKNVVAIKGSALTANQVSLIKRFTENIALALDEDAAGNAASRRGIELADQEGLNIRVVRVQYGKDPDECAQHSPKLWRDSVKKAVSIYDFYFKSAVRRFGKKGAESKKRISEELIPVLVKIANEVVKAHYIKKLTGILEVNEEAIIREMERLERKDEIGEVGRKVSKPSFTKASEDSLSESEGKGKSRRERLEELILAMVLQQKKQIKKWLKQVEIEQIKFHPIKKIFKALKKFVKNLSSAKSFKINDFVKKLADELIETLDRAYLEDLKIDLIGQNKFAQEFDKAKKELDKLFFKEELSVLVGKMKKIEKKPFTVKIAKNKMRDRKLENLKREFNSISQKLKDIV